MITFCLLMILLLILIVVAIVTLGVGGIAFLLTYGDIIICVVIIIFLIRWLIKKIKK